MSSSDETRLADVRHALTIDVEEWYQVENLSHLVARDQWNEQPSRLKRQIAVLLDLLDEYETKATFFVLGMAAQREPSVVGDIIERGHELACHGWSHRLIYRQDPEEFRAETRRAKSYLEDLGGREVRGYRASTFSITARSLWALDILAEVGFAYDSSVAPLRHDRYGIPDSPIEPHLRTTSSGPILECPISFGRMLGGRIPLGGGFMRLLPAAWTLRTLRNHRAAGRSANLYFHPWELDRDQPVPDALSGLRRFRHTHGLSRFPAKLRTLLSNERFAPLGDLVGDRLRSRVEDSTH
ncbi:MAG: XrtA system polysaccharide deacetylase [Planctomycetota bacterium]|jgi:polysaccharide deacetylase family protein (PEP-CTERM system associated)